MFSPCGGSVISFIDNGLLRGWATADVEEINGGIFFFLRFFSARWVTVPCCGVWCGRWFWLFLAGQLVWSVHYFTVSWAPVQRAVTAVSSSSTSWTAAWSYHWRVLRTWCLESRCAENATFIYVDMTFIHIHIYIYVCVWKISNNLHTMYDGFNSREDINQHITTLVFSSQF